mmetsp:Transcript_41971/g.115803  ORF Transcript_41971/g.115803 Transcript_41971/m.115803 type:complete len:511 (-) Transcript_41971:166-1698(-)
MAHAVQPGAWDPPSAPSGADRAARGQTTYALRCPNQRCGNVFADDAKFCRLCGVARPVVLHAWSPAPSEPDGDIDKAPSQNRSGPDSETRNSTGRNPASPQQHLVPKSEPNNEVVPEKYGVAYNIGQGVADFSAHWFGALHLQHLAPADVEAPEPTRAQLAQAAANKAISDHTVIKVDFQHVKIVKEDDETEVPVIERQHLPIFLLLQGIVCLTLYVLMEYGLQNNPDLVKEIALLVQRDCKDNRLQVWRWITYQFAHVSFDHVLQNCILLAIFGTSLEGYHGFVKTALIFNIGVFGGACCYFVADIHAEVVGMSGGCYSLLGMQLGDILMNFTEHSRAARYFRDEMQGDTAVEYWKRMIFSPWLKLFMLLLIAALNIVEGILTLGSQTSHSVHVGGAIAGFFASIVIGENYVLRGREKCAWISALVVGFVLAAACVVWAMQWPPRHIFDQVPWCWARSIANITVFEDTRWHCVRCPDDDCISRWSIHENLVVATERLCDQTGGWSITER